MAVAELVPEVALAQRLGVAALEQLGAGGGLEQLQVRRLGLVPARDQAVDLGAASKLLTTDGKLRVRLIADHGSPFDLAVDRLAVTAQNRT